MIDGTVIIDEISVMPGKDSNQEIARLLRDVAQRIEGGELLGSIQDVEGKEIGEFVFRTA
jgi:hypothetical protein